MKTAAAYTMLLKATPFAVMAATQVLVCVPGSRTERGISEDLGRNTSGQADPVLLPAKTCSYPIAKKWYCAHKMNLLTLKHKPFNI
ncbi:hypothetical protein HDC92_001392 [Pedobacter sp. AK017]|uniref:hypothetical protein n=1 Tax=Pedobacter sp. AK017 TaxID=2723073 RepID=UPI001621B286|nr:hypothetical protein [Pedobacter sp. AK017]MBB5437718.1 hypothetical protein [Pedobacter sp. AK017]